MFILVTVLLLQVARVVIAAYCQHETGTVVHFGHHSADYVPGAPVRCRLIVAQSCLLDSRDDVIASSFYELEINVAPDDESFEEGCVFNSKHHGYA